MDNERGVTELDPFRREVTTTKQVSKLTSLSIRQIHHIVSRGLVTPTRGPRNRFEYSFQDIVILRRIKEMLQSSISMRKILKNVSALRTKRAHQPLSAVNFQTYGSEIVVQEQRVLWNPESGQTLLNFDGEESTAPENIEELPRGDDSSNVLVQDLEKRIAEGGLTSEDWYQIGLDLESIADSDRACKAYRQAIRLDESNVNAYLNLGRLLQLSDKLPDAKRLYEKVLQFVPDSELACYNLGTIFDTLDEFELAIKYYRRAPNMAQAHHNLSRIYELLGDEVSARRHFKRSKELEDRYSGG